MGGKVAEIEFFEVGNYAEIGHLSADKVTKISDKVFALFQTVTTAMSSDELRFLRKFLLDMTITPSLARGKGLHIDKALIITT